MSTRYDRLEKIIGSNNLSLLRKKTVLVLGCGGVGGYVIESLARSGIGNIIIVDFDKVDITNINRQIIALNSTIDKYKVDLFEERINDIDENINVIKFNKEISKDNYLELFNNNVDYFIDCCDTVNVKKLIIKECLNRNVKLISCMGTANRLDPSKLEICDIRKTKNDPLSRIMRKFVKDEKINKKVIVCSSSEVPIRSNNGLGSSSFVPGSAGLLIGSYVLKELIKK